MTEPEVHSQSTVHEQDTDSGGDAQAWRARTRGSVPSPGATIIDLTQRHRARVAERWGKPIEEPPPDVPTDPDAAPQFADVLNQLHLYRGPSPSPRAILHDLRQGGARAYEEGGLAVAVAYWAAGAPGYVLVWVCEIGKITCARPGRIYAALFVASLLWVALALAGLNPVPLSALNPFS